MRTGRFSKRRLCGSTQCKALHERYRLTADQHARLRVTTTCDACGGRARYGQAGAGPGVLVVDHDHRTGAVRGFLGASCNLAAGLAEDDPDLLRGLAAYLERGEQIPAASVPQETGTGCPVCAAPPAVSRGTKPATYCGTVCRGVAGNARRRFDLTAPQLRWLAARHSGCCWACREPFDRSARLLIPVIDHDHGTGNLRGLLHGRCNIILGKVGDDADTLRALAAYLEARAAR